MIDLDLTGSERRLFEAALRTSHSIRIEVHVLDMQGDVIGDVSDRLIGGQVDVNRHSNPTRTATVQLLDVGRTLSFDSESPAKAAVYFDRQLRITYCVKVDAVGWVRVPIFTGPISSMQRTDTTLELTCEGKDVLAMGAAWHPMTLKRGHNKIDAIHDILQKRAGENKFRFPTGKARLGKELSLGRQSVPLRVCKKLARSMDKQLFWDGRGYARLRTLPGKPVWDFVRGDGGDVLTEATIDFSLNEFTNIVWIKGGIPHGQRKHASYWFTAPFASPLSPESLGRNGVPRYMLETVEDDTILNRKDAQELAKKHLDRKLQETVHVSFDALVIPHLEEGDLVSITTDEFATTFRLDEFSIPLAATDAMTVNYTRVLKVPRRHRRTFKKKAHSVRSHTGTYGKPLSDKAFKEAQREYRQQRRERLRHRRVRRYMKHHDGDRPPKGWYKKHYGSND